MYPFLWVVLAVSAGLSCFFALTGFALRDFSRMRLEEAFGAAGRTRLALFERHLQALRLTASLGRALSNIFLVIAILYLLAGMGHALTRAILTALVAGAIVAILGVAIPHAWASHAGEKALAATLPVLMAVCYLLYPVVSVMRALDVPIRRLSGADRSEAESDEDAKQEILQAASEGRAEGAVDAEEVKMIASVIQFGDIQAREIMTPRTDIFALAADLPMKDILAQVVKAGHTRVPVYEGDLDNIIGILYVKDLLSYVGSTEPVDLRRIIRKPFLVPETKTLDDLLREFKARTVHLAIVLDEYGGTAGLISIEDILEEIVGDISDEYDQAAPVLMKRLDARTTEVDGRLRIDELNDALALQIPEQQDYDTVAGLVFSELGYIPAVGETVDRYGAVFTVLAADERKITRLRVELPERRREPQ